MKKPALRRRINVDDLPDPPPLESKKELATELPSPSKSDAAKRAWQTIYADKLAHALVMQAKAQTRVKRAVTLHDKWTRRVKHYERRLAGGK